MILMLTELMSGLALFLFGMKFMSESLQRAAGDRMKGILDRFTKNKIVAVLFGAVFTAIIQSSGATTVMEVSFVNAGLMTLAQSVGITFGANIGTTITSQLVSLKLTAVAPYIIFLGAMILTFGKKPMWRKIAEITFGFGALFLGINSMTAALGTIPQFPRIMRFFTYLDNPLIALIVGLIFTVIVQSSSVTVSVLVLLADSGLVGLAACLFFILGANIGSCTPAMMAGMDANRDGKRAALVHLLFNVLGMVVISIILIFALEPVTNLIAAINGPENAKRFVANADTIFKTFQTIIFLPFSNQILKLTGLLVKEDTSEEGELAKKLIFIHRGNKFQAQTAVTDIVKEIERMGILVSENLEAAMAGLLGTEAPDMDAINEKEDLIDYLSSEITDYMVEVNRLELPYHDAMRIGDLFHVVIDLERIGDHAVNFAEDAEKKQKQNLSFTEGGIRELRDMYAKASLLLGKSMYMFVTEDKSEIGQVIALENQVDEMDRMLQDHHIDRLSHGRCSAEIGLIFTDTVIGLERIGDHALNIAYTLFRKNPEEKEILSV
ncbi:MAG: Na/Pi cotransporter family protein [Eubacterium sp.]|nr:Na/Pi cotransporter family protein [Eubacterium sp.]